MTTNEMTEATNIINSISCLKALSFHKHLKSISVFRCYNLIFIARIPYGTYENKCNKDIKNLYVRPEQFLLC